ncbi:hypothetical protein Q7P36_006276 [Cladosporium allicinum]
MPAGPNQPIPKALPGDRQTMVDGFAANGAVRTRRAPLEPTSFDFKLLDTPHAVIAAWTTTRVTSADDRGIGYLLIGNIYTLALEPSAIDIWKSVDMIAVWILVPSAIGQLLAAKGTV